MKQVVKNGKIEQQANWILSSKIVSSPFLVMTHYLSHIIKNNMDISVLLQVSSLLHLLFSPNTSPYSFLPIFSLQGYVGIRLTNSYQPAPFSSTQNPSSNPLNMIPVIITTSLLQRCPALDFIIINILMQRNLYLDSQDFEENIDWNPQSNFQEEQLQFAHQNQQQSDPMDSQKKRPSHKNKYINKITLIKPEETVGTKKKQMIENQLALEPEQLKKLKNREAAKQSRERKKLYINLIEEQNKNLQKELDATSKEIESCKIQIQKSTFNNNQSIGTFDSKLKHVFHRMVKLINSQENQERDSDLNVAIDSVLYRFGATGKERKNNISQSYKQILSLSYPNTGRYLLWAAREKTHLFLTKETFNIQHQAWFSDMKKILEGVTQNNQVFLQKKGAEIMKNLSEMHQMASKIKRIKHQIEDFCYLIDSVFLQIRQILTPVQSAKLILLIQQYKYREQLRYLQAVGFDEDQKALGEPKKHVKQQQL